MNIKPILINTALAFALSGCLAQAESVEDQPQVNIASEHYEVRLSEKDVFWYSSYVKNKVEEHKTESDMIAHT